MENLVNILKQKAESQRAESFKPVFKPISDGKQRLLLGFPCESMCEKACESRCENACK